jgi:hypothetical protein
VAPDPNKTKEEEMNDEAVLRHVLDDALLAARGTVVADNQSAHPTDIFQHEPTYATFNAKLGPTILTSLAAKKCLQCVEQTLVDHAAKHGSIMTDKGVHHGTCKGVNNLVRSSAGCASLDRATKVVEDAASGALTLLHLYIKPETWTDGQWAIELRRAQDLKKLIQLRQSNFEVSAPTHHIRFESACGGLKL